MDAAFRSPLLEFFRRGEVARDIRELAARGALAPRAHEQLMLLRLLVDDPDPGIAQLSVATLARIPAGILGTFLARPEVDDDTRSFFRARGIEAAEVPAGEPDAPLFEPLEEPEATVAEGGEEQARQLSTLSVPERLKLAMRGSREQRGILVRDPNKLVAAAVLSSPKLTDSEVESFTRMGSVSEEVLRVIGTNRSWLRNYSVAAGLARNPKTPPAVAVPLVSRLNDRDVKMLAVDRNVPEAVRVAARKVLAVGQARRR